MFRRIAAVASAASTLLLGAPLVSGPYAGGLAAHAAPAKPRADVVRFTFAWPAGQDLGVRADKRLVRNAAVQSAQVLEYRLFVQPEPPGFRVAPGNLEIVRPGPTPNAPPRREPLPFMQARAAAPAFRIDAAGRFQGVANDQAARTAVAKSAKDAVDRAGLAEAFADDEEAFEETATSAVVEQIARDYWDPVIGQWVGAEFVLDREYVSDTTVPLPMFGGVTVPAKRSVYVHRAPDCERDGQPRRCVYVEISIGTEPGALESVLNGVVGGARIVSSAGGPIASATMVATATLLVEPDGLIPHEYEYENAVRYTSTDELSPGEVSNIETDRRVYRFVRR